MRIAKNDRVKLLYKEADIINDKRIYLFKLQGGNFHDYKS